MKYKNRDVENEENLKIAVARDYFGKFKYDTLGKIDFCISQRDYSPKGDAPAYYFLWAEAKKGSSEIEKSLAQLIITVGKERSFEKVMPAIYLGCFDAEKIAFVPYSDIQDIFYINDFNWNVTPSNRETKEFKLISEKITKIPKGNILVFNFENDEKELRDFIKHNFVLKKTGTQKTPITKTNFVAVFQKWQKELKCNAEYNWEVAKKLGIVDGDFYLADLLSENHQTIKENLWVILKSRGVYEFNKHKTATGSTSSESMVLFLPEKYDEFWARYERPPKEELWDYMIDRRDLLVPADIRERKGSFYTPRQWVELSQEYLAEVFGENWQEDYVIWDCAAGTGNLLANLTESQNLYASTLDKADVKVMQELAKTKSLHLLENHIFQFDFLNDDLKAQKEGGKLPDSLFEIINNPEKRKKLIIYINPPYAEAGNARQRVRMGVNKANVSKGSKIYNKYCKTIKQASNEVFALFLIQACKNEKLFCCKIANFSTLKNLQSSNFYKFRQEFQAKLERLFVVPANTFDNVKGEFPISFQIWDTEKKEIFTQIKADVFDKNGNFIKTKSISAFDKIPRINKWIKKDSGNFVIGMMNSGRTDFQNQNLINIQNEISTKASHALIINITPSSLIQSVVFFAVRHCIKATWLNDRDQFLFPNVGWETDFEFQNDCLAFTLFHNQNRVVTKDNLNHWLPFREQEVDAPERFSSNFMTDFISGKLSKNQEVRQQQLFPAIEKPSFVPTEPLQFSQEAQAVFDAGRAIWQYYYQKTKGQNSAKVNKQPTLYEIKEYFKGRNEKGKLNNKSKDEKFNRLLAELSDKLQILAEKIQPKVYEYEFLRD